MTSELLLFALAGRRFALPLAGVVEVLPAAAFEPLPGAPPSVCGVLNLRGQPTPVLDLHVRLGGAASAPAPSDHYILAETPLRRVVLRTAGCLGLRTVAAGAVKSAEQLAPGLGHLTGALADGDGVLLLYDLESLLGAAEELVLETALAALSSPNRRNP